jgi:ubiquinone/menaquinone biosynthesis C-methylase UbiE
MSDMERGQVVRSAAEVYEAFFVPALFAEWGGRVADAAQIRGGERVLDVACGTGILARAVSDRVGPSGTVVGLDINPEMLAVAEMRAPGITWRNGAAEALPFESESFDAVVSQFGLMFFTDGKAAIHEMARVLRPGGRLAIAVWDALDNTPGYAAMVALLQRLFGKAIADGLRAPFRLGDPAVLRTLFDDAGFLQAKITTVEGTACFPSLEAWIYTDIKGWTMADAIDDEQYARLLTEAKSALGPYVTATGSIAFEMPAHIITLTA